ncbi:MAG: CoA transferase [Spirochaetota bacterium]|nr:CoA transferase [Spirochaetota bacterium]
MQRLPLQGIRVVDFCHVWAGPHATHWLSTMGAEVIKVESELRPDLTRHYYSMGRKLIPGMNKSVDFAVFNYGKKSCTLNMTHSKAREIAKEIIEISDVVTENFGGPVMDRWGLGYQDLKELKSDIIMYSGSGFGRTGPYNNFPAYAPIVDAFCGFTSMNGYYKSEPLPFGVGGWTDIAAAQHGAFSILVALYHRSKTGEGQYIDLSMTEMACATLPYPAMDYAINKRVQERQGNRDNLIAPHGCYPCKSDDEWIAIAVSNEDEWRAFCIATGHPEWEVDKRFNNNLNRWKNQKELDQLISEWTKDHTQNDVMGLLLKAGVMAGASLKINGVIEDQNLNKRGFFIDVDQADMGTVRIARLPWKMSNTLQKDNVHTPSLGEHNDYVFGELLGMTDDEISKLKAEQVIQ